MSGIFIDKAAILALSPGVRAAVFAVLSEGGSVEGADDEQLVLDEAAAREIDLTGYSHSEPTDLTPLSARQMKKFVQGVGPKTTGLLKFIAVHLAGKPKCSELMAHGEYKTWQDMRGFFAGLTKRVRTVTADEEAVFWGYSPGPAAFDENGDEWRDDYVILHPQTLASLRAVFGKTG